MRLASILRHVLVTSTFVACGGQTVGVDQGTSGASSGSSSGASSSSGSTTSSGGSTSGTTPTTDAGKPDTGVDSGVCAPVLVRAGGSCSDVWQQPCGVPAGIDPRDGMSPEECSRVCGVRAPAGTYWGCNEYLLDDLPGPSFECYTCVEGRRPEGYREGDVPPTVAGWLAHATDLERVSIDAFQILGRELAHHAAPAELVASAARAEADEVRHARALGALARREGVEPRAISTPHGPVRPLIAIAIENAIEGCVRETYGALVAAHQAEHAKRRDVRRAMTTIARDEASHAELAWNVHAWLMTRLTSDERARVEEAMTRAIAELAHGARCEPPPALRDDLGLPAARTARRLVLGLTTELFRPAMAA
ncbi:MAG: ferritin-like domain-containing protein [Deltaproteobacteria bacterium]|nr:ferritin-like domain-containing protein [Deltaproteobacteria bacterium]